ncbi:Na+/H+ antiporter subunit E [Microbulbifer agarilyticus]|uniref:Na+/H+ antiporter subunit E n=1 Tax=Microbulbifer agarilyticus TaxID=260552 RepID=UPI001CD57AB8|nr:Na+/H+ antiporter subunit E [Microbulbifer agarilyticus]MCA0899498.1 Na+/H+ antiporter subunit E [Microbulbifer agarilyticus]
MRYTFCLFAVLAFIWLTNSGLYTPLLLSFGLISVVFVILIARRMKVVDGESLPLELWATLPGYYLWLWRKIVASNLEVAACVWGGLFSRNETISPCSERIPTKLGSDLGKVLYANSITLTPGTVAIDVDDDSVLVHALTRSGLNELKQGEMENQILALTEKNSDSGTNTGQKNEC